MAIIEVFPGNPTAIQDAVNSSNEGDVIVVHKGVYVETVQVLSDKNNIRIVSQHKYSAILNGKSNLPEAFTLQGVAGVQIEGFTIKNYRSSGIRISNGKSNRIVQNKISDIHGGNNPLGISVSNSVGNLLLKNVIERIGSGRTGSGIKLHTVSGNWVIKNKLQNNSAHGLEVIDSSHDAIVGNQISNNKGEGILMNRLDNNLILDNTLSHNGVNGVNAQSTNNLIVDCKIKANCGNGLLLTSNYNFAGFNEIKVNAQSGILISSDFNDIQANKIEKNDNNGVFIQKPRTANFVFENQLKHNKPRNIEDQGENNNIVQNKSSKR